MIFGSCESEYLLRLKPFWRITLLMTILIYFFLQSDLKLKKYLHIIESSPVFPVLYDSKRYLMVLRSKL